MAHMKGIRMKNQFTDSGIINSDPGQAEHVIIGIPFDGTSSGSKGADKGPKAVREMLECQIEPFISGGLNFSPCEKTKIAWLDLGDMKKFASEQMVRLATKQCLSLLRAGKELTIVGGEHSVTIPALQAISQNENPAEITIVYFDAHLDLRDKDEFRKKPFGKFSHCCVMRRAWEFGFREFVQIGARSYSEEEYLFAQKHGFSVFFAGWKMPQPRQIVQKIRTKKVWISLDIDGICPGDMPATGTAVGGGPGLDYVREVLWQIAQSHEIVGLDIVEIAPPLGATDLTAYNAAQIVYEMIGYRLTKPN